jgi:anti-sigma regulatory factor (Ser/Thr protein kinase)
VKRSRHFAHGPESVTLARRFAGEVLQGTARDAQETVVLMISELASNCVRHTDSGFELTIIQSGAEIRVEAADTGGGKPTMRTPGPTDPDGRGLQIVDIFASAWGIDRPAAGGKTVWFELATQAPARVEAAPA